MPMQNLSQETVESLWFGSFDSLKRAVDRITFETILKNASPVMKNPKTMEIQLSKTWQRDHLVKYVEVITDIIRGRAGEDVKLELAVNPNGGSEDPPLPVETPKKPATPKQKAPKQGESGEFNRYLHPNYTFDNFIVGSGNRFAAAAAQAVAKNPARAYNPLFIYGGVGLGKTHLINAIGHNVLEVKPDAKVVYVSTEKFMNDMIDSIREKKMKQFRGKYRNVDVLLIDDIQFIKNKESTQEEFFHTFNELHSAKSQIVITSDRPPKDIPTLEDRLRSRFEWGLIADISQPDLETRIAILKKKTETEKIDSPDSVISYIAEKIPSNIRELEGAFNRVICYASLMNQPINLEMTQSVLKDIVPDTRPRHLTIKFIQEKVCEYFNIRMSDILGARREQKLVVPRQIAMYLSKELIGASYPDIGKAFGGRDHTTIMHAYKKINRLKRNPSMKNDLENVKNIINNPCE